MSLITVDLRDRKQLYEQLVDNVKGLVLKGSLRPDDKLPSVRSLAKELGINPNTIQKAYTELERCGVIVTLPGRGSIIKSDAAGLRDERTEKIFEKLKLLSYEAWETGIDRNNFLSLAEKAGEIKGGVTDDND